MTALATKPADTAATRRTRRGRIRDQLRAHKGAAALTLLCLVVYLTFSLTEYAQYLSNGFDLGIFDQAVRSYAHFQAPVSSVKAPGFDVLGDHFSPVVALFAPLYWIWDNPCMLLIAQAFLVAASVPIVYRIVLRRASRVTAVLISAVYGLAWPTQSMVNFDVHEIAFAVPVLAAALDALDRRDGRQLALWTVGLLFIKEDLAFVVMMIGLVMALRGRADDGHSPLKARLRKPPGVAIGLVLGGVLAYAVTTHLVIPAFSPGGSFVYWQYDAIGKNMSDAIGNLITRPWHAAAVFFRPFPKTLTLIMLFLPLALVPLRSPYTLIALPLLAERFFNARVQLWVPQFHYSILPWLVLVVAFVDGASRMQLLDGEKRPALRRALLTWLCVFEFFAAWATNAIEQASSDGRGVFQRIKHWNEQQVRDRAAGTRVIPNNVCVEADNGLIPHLTYRDYVTLPGAKGIRPDFVVLDLSRELVGPSQDGAPGDPGAKSKTVAAQLNRGRYQLIHKYGTVLVYRAIDYTGPSAECHPMGSGRRPAT